jgi:hypothetical protein
MGPEAATSRLVESLRAQATAAGQHVEVDVSVGEIVSATDGPVAGRVSEGIGAQYVYFGHVSERKYVNIALETFLDLYEHQRGEGCWAATGRRGVYLAQMPLYSAPGVLRDRNIIDTRGIVHDWLRVSDMPDFFGNESLSNINCWINLDAARSSLHFDSYHNLLLVLQGRKHLRLLPPSAALKDSSPSGPPLRAEPAASASANHANYRLVDDAVRAGALTAAEITEISLGPGECILLPEGYWHEVASEPCTVALVRASPVTYHTLIVDTS